MAQPPDKPTDGWLPFTWSDVFCVGDRGKGGPPPASVPPDVHRVRPLAGLTFLLPTPLPGALRSQIRYLGGRIVGSIDGATFCIVPCGLRESDLVADYVLAGELKKCRATGIAVVEASWLDEIAQSLAPGEDWTRVSVDPHIPMVMALLDEVSSSSGSIAASAREPAAARSSSGRRQPPPAGLPPTQSLSTAAAAASAAAISAQAAAGARRKGLEASLGETYAFLRRNHPDQVEEDQLAKAVERSLLDFAIRLRHVGRGEPSLAEEPHTILKASSARSRRRSLQLSLQSRP